MKGFCFDIGIECQAESGFEGPLDNPVNDDAQRGLPDAVGDNVLAFVAQVVKTAAGQATTYPAAPDGTAHQPWVRGRGL